MQRMMHRATETARTRTIKTNESAIRVLSPEEVMQVSGGMMDTGGPHTRTHTPGRLTPDESEYGTIAGAGL